MNKLLFHSAMLAMIFATAVMATSCQKEKEKEENTVEAVSHFNPANLQIEDMNAYLEGFKEKMGNAEAKGSSEIMGIEEAAWHLSSVANHDFANICAPHDTLRFDTLYFHMDVTDGKVSVADMNALYEEMSQAIVNFKKGLACENPNFWYIDTEISENGDVTIPIVTMYINSGSKYWGDQYWHLTPNTADSICAIYLDSTITYYADSNAMTTLEYMLMLQATYSLSGGQYFTDYDYKVYTFQNYIDPNGSPFYCYSRLYASTGIYHNPISYTNMCYAFDSYAGLAWGTVYEILDGIVPVCYDLEFLKIMGKIPRIGHHKMSVHRMQYHTMAPPPDPGNNG